MVKIGGTAYLPVKLTTNVSPVGGGNVTPSSGTYAKDEVVEVTAVPAVNHSFSSWSGDANSSDNPLSLTMDTDKDITANFSTMSLSSKLTVEGTEYFPEEMEVERNSGDFNSTSNFRIELTNNNGVHDDTFNLNDEVIIYADRGIYPATTKLLTGVIEDITFQGFKTQEVVIISGRDYGAVLQDVAIEPVVFKNRDAGEIAKIIVEQNSNSLVTIGNINISTGTTVTRIAFNYKNVFDSLKELAELSSCYFYVDENKSVHFDLKNGTSSGKIFDNNNVSEARFKNNDNEIFNKVWVYGDRILTGATDAFTADGAGSVFTLSDKPHNTRVLVDSVLQEKGGIITMDNPNTISGIKYVVDFNEKEIVFVSGTSAGEHIPGSLAAVQVDYERSTPLASYYSDDTSISNYGPKSKLIVDNSIKDFEQADEMAVAFIAEHKDPIIEGYLKVAGVLSLTPGNTCVVDLPYHGISSQTYTIISATYVFNKANNLADDVLRVTVNKKVKDFADVMKDQMLKIRNVEAGALEGTLTRLELTTGSMVMKTHYEAWATAIGSAFIFHSNTNDRLDSTQSVLGEFKGATSMITSGGDY